jgi:hypothetical protein
MNNETAQLLWAIREMLMRDGELYGAKRNDGERLSSFISVCRSILAGYDFDVKK